MNIKVWITVFLAVVALPAVAAAHNVGHVFLPDGTCLEVGSAREAPFVGQDRTQLDLVPGTPNPPRDEYGTSFVGYWGNTPILPGRCPATTATLSSMSPARPAATVAATKSSAPAPVTSFGSVGPWMSRGARKDK
jgi:hypothetical protein